MSESETFPRLVMSRLPDGRGGMQVLEFELLDHIGAGGMGTVYRARHVNPPDTYIRKHGDKPRIVALKYLHKHMMQVSDDAVARFVREAKLLQSLRHPNVVRIFGLGIDQEGVPFFALELVEDAQSLASLRDVWSFRRQMSGRDPATGKIVGSLVPLSVLIPILRQLFQALREVHAKGIVHRDIKPDNILLTKDGVVKLTDFGISKSLEKVQDPALTIQGRVVGTPSYVSPEAACECRIDPRNGKAWYVSALSDIYALGVMLYELLTGVLPFDADASELPQDSARTTQMQNQLIASLILGKVVADHVKPRPLTDLLVNPNPLMVALVEACMSKGPWDRPASCEVMLEVLDQIEAYESQGVESDDQQKITTLVSMESAGDMALAPTQLDSVPPRGPARNSDGVPPPAELEVGSRPPQEKAVSASPKKSAGMTYLIVASLATSASIFAVLWWGSMTGKSPNPQTAVAAATNPNPVPSDLSRVTVPVQASTRPEKRKPDPGPTVGTRSYTVYQNGLSAARNGDCRRAASEMLAVLAAYPAFPKPFRILGDCARRSGDRDGARENYEKYLSFEGVEPLPPDAMKLVEP